jgi:hypothetical protein
MDSTLFQRIDPGPPVFVYSPTLKPRDYFPTVDGIDKNHGACHEIGGRDSLKEKTRGDDGFRTVLF